MELCKCAWFEKKIKNKKKEAIYVNFGTAMKSGVWWVKGENVHAAAASTSTWLNMMYSAKKEMIWNPEPGRPITQCCRCCIQSRWRPGTLSRQWIIIWKGYQRRSPPSSYSSLTPHFRNLSTASVLPAHAAPRAIEMNKWPDCRAINSSANNEYKAMRSLSCLN